MTGSSPEMGIFERVAARGSFAGAAEDVGLSPSAVAKLITRLERRLGVRLINRTTRRLALTAEGEIYLGRVREILGAIEAAEAELTSARVSPRGHLRVHTYPVLAAHLAEALPEFLARCPQITFDFMVTNRIVDLIGENVDISMRLGPLNDSMLVARKLVDLTRVVCASPNYLARHGRPTEPSDLVRHSCLTLSGRLPDAVTWPFRVNGKLIRINVGGSVSADSADMLLKLAIEGVGILRLSEHIVASSIQRGLLQPLLQDVQDPQSYPLCALMPPGRHQTLKVRAFLDFLVERLGSAPWRIGAKGNRRRKFDR